MQSLYSYVTEIRNLIYKLRETKALEEQPMGDSVNYGKYAICRVLKMGILE